MLDFCGQRVYSLVFGGDSSRTIDVKRYTPCKLRVWTCAHMIEFVTFGAVDVADEDVAQIHFVDLVRYVEDAMPKFG